jgi:hypothetical protein
MAVVKKPFTERHGAAKPRVSETLDDTARNGLWTLISGQIDEEWFGLSFPQKCDDGYAYAGTDFTKFRAMMEAYGLLWPRGDFDRYNPPSDGQMFDLLEFSYEFIAEAKNPSLHAYMSHSHYHYDRESGQDKFTEDVNRILERSPVRRWTEFRASAL